MMDTVPYRKLTEAQEALCLELLRPANTLLKKWSESFGPRKAREFRKMLFKGHRNPVVMAEVEARIDPDQVEQFRRERKTIIAVHVSELPELGNRTVEMAMLSGYAGLARKHAKKWFGQNGEGSGSGENDYLNEAYLVILDCIYGYTKDDIAFSSFVWESLKNRMIYVTNKNNMLCPLTNPDLALLAQYEDARRSFNDHVTFDEVAQAMGLSEKQYKTLGSIMTKVVSESQIITQEDPDGGEASNDYTSLRLGIDTETEEDRILKMNVWEAIERAGLNEFERLVLETSMEPYYGWQSQVARNNTNPKTGNPYTRMWVGMALRSAEQKVKAALSLVA